MKCKEGYKQVDGKCVKKGGLKFGFFSRLADNNYDNSQEKEKDILRAKWVIIPLLFISAFVAFTIPSLLIAGLLYILMILISAFTYFVPAFKEEVIGLRKGVGRPLVIGSILASAFFLLQELVPGFSILIPNISYSVSSNLRAFVIIGIAPLAEELFRSATIAFLKETFRKKDWNIKFSVVNISQALLFALLHSAVYGVAFDSYSFWFQVVGSFIAILGSIISAFVFGLISGYIMEKTNNILPSIIAHGIINFVVLSKTNALVVVATEFIPIILNIAIP